jgi:hypothetical protein
MGSIIIGATTLAAVFLYCAHKISHVSVLQVVHGLCHHLRHHTEEV